LLALLCSAAGTARADEIGLLRFYYSKWISGAMLKSPLDPEGQLAGKKLELLSKGEVELILWDHLGVSYTGQKIGRKTRVGPSLVEEYSFQTFTSLTLYPFASRHNAFNLFIGAGRGQAQFEVRVDRVFQEDPLYKGIPLKRRFAGMEYTYERVGYRLEAMAVNGMKQAADGRVVEIIQRLGYFTMYIPFN